MKDLIGRQRTIDAVRDAVTPYLTNPGKFVMAGPGGVAMAAVNAVRAVLAQPNDDWQPIETAPKDGSTILVCDAALKDSQKIVFWDEEEDGSTYPWCVEDGGCYSHNAFSHWKPLDPQPPPRSPARASDQ